MISKSLPVVLFVMILLLFAPVPPFLLDVLLIANLALSFVIFLASIYAKNVLEFSSLPILLIFTTLIRIVLNVTSSKLILGEATGGKLISAIGEVTIGGNIVVGVIIFIIITLVMFLVINKGVERMAEVSARFKLDEMGTAIMDITNELNNGVISPAVADMKKKNLNKSINFYKSMDGAAKFIKGDSIAGIIITVVNILGGLATGVWAHGMEIGTAASTYTILTVGDGLVNQIPALLVAIGTAITMAKGSDESDDNIEELLQQLAQYSEVITISGYAFVVAAMAGMLGVVPNLPWSICLVMGALLLFLSRKIKNKKKEVSDQSEILVSPELEEEIIETPLRISPIVLEVGSDVAREISVRDEGTNSYRSHKGFKERIEKLKDRIKDRYGFKIPDIRITSDSYDISANSFIVKIPNVAKRVITVKSGCDFAMFYSKDTVIDFGEEVSLLEIGMDGFWVPKDRVEEVENMGGIVYSLHELMIFYMEKTITSNLDKFINREMIKVFKDEVELYNAAIIKELNDNKVENSVIQKIVKTLLYEKIPIKNFEFILECIADNICLNKTDGGLSEIRSQLMVSILDDKLISGKLNIVGISAENTEFLRKIYSSNSADFEEQTRMFEIMKSMVNEYRSNNMKGMPFVFMLNSDIRYSIFDDIYKQFGEKLDIIAIEELVGGIEINYMKEL